jgi:hypothetical protein
MIPGSITCGNRDHAWINATRQESVLRMRVADAPPVCQASRCSVRVPVGRILSDAPHVFDYLTAVIAADVKRARMTLSKEASMRITPTLILFVSTLAVLVAPHHAAAQTTTDEVLRELLALRAEVRQLRQELDALKAPNQSLEVIQNQIAELAQTKVESTTRFPVKIFGTIHAHAFANSATPNWLDIPNLVNAPVASPGTFSMALRQTRLGFTADGPTVGGARTSGVVAFDFFGGIPGFQTGQVMGLPRLLVAFARVQGDRAAVQVGQDHVLVGPRDPTSLSGFAFPLLFRSGNLYLRAPQARVEYEVHRLVRVAGGAMAPVGGDLVGNEYQFVPPALGGERSRRPAMQARIELGSADPEASRRLSIGAAGHYGWERRATGLVNSWVGALDFGARRDVFGVAGELFVGNNMDAFGGAIGLDARAAGGWAELQLLPTARLAFHAGAGIDDITDPRRARLVRRRNRSAYGNMILSLTPEVQASFEYRWLATTPSGPTEQRNHHFDWVLAYKF